jgi:CHAT domain-containing protein/tetratricopeptide (TPR) repeat protein
VAEPPSAVERLAQRWLEGEAVDAAGLGDGERIALGWALKALGYQAIYSAPARLAGVVERLRALERAAREAPARRELAGLAAWIAGVDSERRGQPAEALALYDQARADLLAVGRRHEAAQTQVPKMVALSILARHEEALACGEAARAELIEVGDERAAGRVEINLGSILLRRHRYAEAALQYRHAAMRFARVGERRESVLADIGLAGVLAWQHDYDEAARIFERSLARVRAHGLAQLEGVIGQSRGLLELRRGRHAQALRWLESALRVLEGEGSPPPQLAEARCALADAYLALNLLPEAVALYDQAIAGCRDNPAALEAAWATMQRAIARARQGAVAEAERGLAEAADLFRGGGNVVGAARAVSHAAELALRRGDAAPALLEAGRAAAALRVAGMRGWALEAELLAAEATLALERLADAEQRLRELLEACADQPELQARCATGLARVARTRGDVTGALLGFEQAAAAIEAQRASLPGDEFRTAYSSDKQSAFDALLELALADTDRGAAARVLACMERARAQALQIGLQRGDAPVAGDAEQRARRHWLQQQWQEATALGRAQQAAALAAELRRAEADALESHRRAQVARTQGPPPGAPAFAAARLHEALGPGEALVAYAWLGRALAVVVVRSGRITHLRLDAGDVARRVEQLRFQINALRFGAPALAAHAAQMQARAQAHLRALHAALWAPLEPLLEGVDHAVVLPHGVLHYVPFAALHDGRQALVDRLALSMAPSAALWLEGRATSRPAPRRALALGIGGPTLPHVASEVHAVAEAFGGAATVLLDTEASLAHLRRALPGADVLHLACHGQFRADSPYFSALQLADGALTLREAAALPLQASLVTLSACETGLSRIAPGDEMLGLVRGFLLAGAPCVMATLWTVDDAGTAQLMRDFYRAWACGTAPAQALRTAQLALREHRPHPYHWAPFVLYGRASARGGQSRTRNGASLALARCIRPG